MLRQDKLGFLINYFAVEDCHILQDIIMLGPNEVTFFIRFGVVGNKMKTDTVYDLLNSYIPINKHFHLGEKVKSFVSKFCIDNPRCDYCEISVQCDYYNNKNIWAKS